MTKKVLMSEQFAATVNEVLADHKPERMLHALGRIRPDGSLALTHWVFDEDAAASGFHVQASPRGQEAIRTTEQMENVTYLGVLHSHPLTVPEPSGQDGRAAQDLLSRNPHVSVMIVGVVVATTTERDASHVMRLSGGELAVYSIERGTWLERADVGSMNVDRDFFQGIAQRLPQGAIEAVDGAHVAIVGAGSLGSTCAEHIVRAGVPRLTLIDPDVVESTNLGRTVYRASDVGQPKVEALAARLREINPDVELQCLAQVVNPAFGAALSAVVRSADVVLGLTDDQLAMAILDTLFGNASLKWPHLASLKWPHPSCFVG